MATTDRDAQRTYFVAATRALVQSLASQLDSKNLELLYDLIDNFEYGVALEWLYSIVKVRSIALSAEQESELHRLAASFDIDLSSVV